MICCPEKKTILRRMKKIDRSIDHFIFLIASPFFHRYLAIIPLRQHHPTFFPPRKEHCEPSPKSPVPSHAPSRRPVPSFFFLSSFPDPHILFYPVVGMIPRFPIFPFSNQKKKKGKKGKARASSLGRHIVAQLSSAQLRLYPHRN